MSSALSPDGKYLLVLNGGYRPPSITVIDAATGAVVGSTPVADGWLGLAFSPQGDRVYVGGGSKAAVFEFTFAGGKLAAGRTFAVVPADKATNRDMIGDVAMTPDGHLIYATDLYHDSVVVINPQSGMVINHIKTGRRPYRILFHPDGKSFFVTTWADGTLEHHDAASGNLLARVPVGAHATDMVWRNGGPPDTDGDGDKPAYAARVFVAAANTNSVYSVAVTEAKELSVVERINVAMTPRQPLGMTPSGLGLSPDGKRLYVACSDGNVAAAVDVSGQVSHVDGFIPAGWYPTAVRVLPSGTLVIVNGKGVPVVLGLALAYGGIVQLLDVRHGPTDDDKQLFDMLAEIGVPAIIAVTKVDKLTKPKVQERIHELAVELELDEDQMIPFSAVTGEGRDELAEALVSLLEQPDWRTP